MDNKMEEILGIILTSLKSKIEVTRISEVLWDCMHSYSVECTHEYNDYTVEEFLVLYKIKYLKSLGIIDNETTESLEDLFSLKQTLENKLGELTRHELYEKGMVDEKAVDNVLLGLEKIEEVLNKYGIVFEEDDYLRMFLAPVHEINYQDIPKCEEIKSLIKEIK